MALPTDQKVGGSSPFERAKQVRRSEPLTGSTNPFARRTRVIAVNFSLGDIAP